MQSKFRSRHITIRQSNTGTCITAALAQFLICTFLVLSGCASQSGPGTADSLGSPTPATTAPSSPMPIISTLSPVRPSTTKLPPLVSLHMINASTGWALTQIPLYSIGGYVLRTTDGGQHWKNISPAYAAGLPYGEYDAGEAAMFLNASVAWVVTARHRVYHTTDGGQTWQERQLKPPADSNDTAYITFINAQDGWIVFNASAASAGEVYTIFRTGDGGNSWTFVSQSGSGATRLPNGYEDWAPGFLNASTGWAGGDYSKFAPSRFYITHDGGISWKQQSLPLPVGKAGALLWVLPPTFFSTTDGLLPVLFYVNGSDEGVILYTTHDGGATWSQSKPLSTYIYQSSGPDETLAALSLVDMYATWVVPNTGTPLYTTSDAGQHWISITAPKGTKIDAISFVSSLVGWAIDRPDFNTSSVLKTTDGGRTWTEVFHTSQPQP